jgi:hypothetical protein
MPVKSLMGRELGFDSQTGELVIFGARFGVSSLAPRARGRDYYVSSTIGAASTSTGGRSAKSYKEASSTLAGALHKVTAGQGDRIIILEGHTETISSSTALTLSKAGVEIIGLGRGVNRPTFTLDTATDATINVTAARVTIRNCIFSANFADIVSFFTLTAAKSFMLEGCKFQATATNMNALYVVDTNATSEDAAGLRIENCEWVEPDLATVGWIKMDGTNDNVKFLDNYSNLGVNNNKSLITVAAGKIVTNLQMGRNRTIRLNTDTATGALLFHTDGSTNSGMVFDNYSQHADTAAELIVTASSGLSLFQNYSSGVNGNSGYVIATIDT